MAFTKKNWWNVTRTFLYLLEFLTPPPSPLKVKSPRKIEVSMGVAASNIIKKYLFVLVCLEKKYVTT